MSSDGVRTSYSRLKTSRNSLQPSMVLSRQSHPKPEEACKGLSFLGGRSDCMRSVPEIAVADRPGSVRRKQVEATFRLRTKLG